MIVDGIQISTFIPKDGIRYQTELSNLPLQNKIV
jgi:hypothetical protein